MGFNNFGTVKNNGKITISNTNAIGSTTGVNFGFGNSGTVNNDGKIDISNTEASSEEFYNTGTTNNYVQSNLAF